MWWPGNRWSSKCGCSQIARQHHAWRGTVIEVLHMIDDPKAAIVAAGLEKNSG